MARSPGQIRSGRLPPPAALRAGVGMLAMAGPPPAAPGTLALSGVQWNIDVNLSPGAPSLIGAGAAPAMPTIAGATLVFDFDFGSPAAGAFPSTLAPRAGSAATAEVVVGGGAPVIGVVSGARRGAVLNGTSDWLRVNNVLADLLPVNPNPEFIIVMVARRPTAGVNAFFLDISRANQSGAASLNRYSFFANATNVVAWRRADGANLNDANSTAVATADANLRIVGRASLNGDQINRVMVNGGAKASSAARSVTASAGAWSRLALGARMINPDGVTMSDFSACSIERLAAYYCGTANSATDAALDSIEAALAGFYT